VCSEKSPNGFSSRAPAARGTSALLAREVQLVDILNDWNQIVQEIRDFAELAHVYKEFVAFGL